MQPPPGAEGEQRRIHSAGGEVVPHGRHGGRNGGRSGRRRAGRRAVGPARQREVFLYIKAAARPAGQVSFGDQELVRRVHGIDRDGQLRRQAALAGQPGAGRQGAGAHFGGQALVELLVQWHLRGRVERVGEMEHKDPSFERGKRFMHSSGQRAGGEVWPRFVQGFPGVCLKLNP